MTKKLIVKNKLGVQTHGADSTQFESLEAFEAWKQQCIESNVWGMSERWLVDSVQSPLSEEEKAKAKDKRKVEVMGEEVEEYFFEAEYEIDVKDITAEIQAEKQAKQDRKHAKEKRKDERKKVDWSKNLTTKQLQEIVKNLIEDKED